MQEPKRQCVTTKSTHTSVARTEKPKPDVIVPPEPAIGNYFSLVQYVL